MMEHKDEFKDAHARHLRTGVPRRIVRDHRSPRRKVRFAQSVPPTLLTEAQTTRQFDRRVNVGTAGHTFQVSHLSILVCTHKTLQVYSRNIGRGTGREVGVSIGRGKQQ